MLSVVIPVYNEGAVLEKTASVIRGVLSDAAIGCELIFVDDGSKDATWEKITALSASGGIRGLHFSRNFGKGSGDPRGTCRGERRLLRCDRRRSPAPAGEDRGDVPPVGAGLRDRRGAEGQPRRGEPRARSRGERSILSSAARPASTWRTPLTSSCSTGRRSTFSSICASGTPFSARAFLVDRL